MNLNEFLASTRSLPKKRRVKVIQITVVDNSVISKEEEIEERFSPKNVHETIMRIGVEARYFNLDPKINQEELERLALACNLLDFNQIEFHSFLKQTNTSQKKTDIDKLFSEEEAKTIKSSKKGDVFIVRTGLMSICKTPKNLAPEFNLFEDQDEYEEEDEELHK